MNKKDIFLDYKSLIKSSLIDVIKHATGLKPHLSFAYKSNKPFDMIDKVKVYKILNKNYFANLNIKPILAIEHCHCSRINDWNGIHI